MPGLLLWANWNGAAVRGSRQSTLLTAEGDCMNTVLMDSPPAPVISDEQLAFFHREGYLVVEDIFTDHDLQPVIDEISAQLDELARAAVKSGTLSRTYEEFDFDHRLAMINRETPEI